MLSAEGRILKFLETKNEAQNVYTIAHAINRSYGYTRHVISKMAKEGQVIRIRRGWYVHKDAAFLKDTIFTMRPLKLHGLKIITKRMQGLPFITITDIVKGANVDLHRHRINHAIIYNEIWRDRLITVTYHPEHTLIIDLRSSENPLSFNDFDAFTGWLEGRFPSIPLGRWKVLQAGFNWDIIGMRLDGVESITMNILKDVWYRLYNKGRDILRVEVHTNINIGLPEALKALEGALDNLEKSIIER